MGHREAELAATDRLGRIRNGLLVFLADYYSSVLVVAGIAYEAPIVFAAIKGTRKLTLRITGFAVVGLVLGWLMDAAQASFIWSEERIENRLLSLVSVLIVCTLVLVLQRKTSDTAH